VTSEQLQKKYAGPLIAQHDQSRKGSKSHVPCSAHVVEDRDQAFG
jgi:hypothetical protein